MSSKKHSLDHLSFKSFDKNSIDPKYDDLFSLWKATSLSRRESTTEDYGRIFHEFANCINHRPLGDISRRDVIGFRDRLIEKGQSPITASRKIGVLKTIFLTAVDHELMPANPADGIRMHSKTQVKQRIAFAADDLVRKFNSAIYTEGFVPRGAGREAAYWLPLLALFTGARVEELAQLLVENVRYVPGLGHYLDITDEAGHAKLKNVASRRRIPVHQTLITCGFLDYAAEVGKRSTFLFPDLKSNPRGRLAGYFTNFFSHYLRGTIGISDTRKVFHSFRHTFKDVCRAVGIEESVHDALTGHTGTGVGRRYGNEQYPLAPLFEAMERYDVDGLDLSHLYRKSCQRQLRPAELRIVSAFYGVLLAFSTAKVRDAEKTVIVAMYQGAQAGIDVESNTLVFGSLAAAKLMLVQAWVEIHREEILASWIAGRHTGNYLQLDPLR